MKTRKKTHAFGKLAGQLQFSIRQQRLRLFWAISLIGLVLPWLPSCETLPRRSVCTVNSIHDGDTLRLTCGGERIKVRLYCIDAPEMGQRPWGRESRDYLRAITPGRVTLIARTRDRYGRTVGELITADQEQENLNLAMVWSGQAAVYPKYCSDRSYYQAEEQARKIRSGIWSRSGRQQRPWQWRHR